MVALDWTSFFDEEQDNLMQNFDNLLQKQGFWTDFLRDLK